MALHVKTGSSVGTNVSPGTAQLMVGATIVAATAGLMPGKNITLETVGVQDTGRLTVGLRATGSRATGVGRMGAIMDDMTRAANTILMMAGIRVTGIRVVGVKRTGSRATGLGRMGASVAVMARGTDILAATVGIRVIGKRLVGMKKKRASPRSRSIATVHSRLLRGSERGPADQFSSQGRARPLSQVSNFIQVSHSPTLLHKAESSISVHFERQKRLSSTSLD